MQRTAYSSLQSILQNLLPAEKYPPPPLLEEGDLNSPPGELFPSSGNSSWEDSFL
jgi:hypothetical protein